MVSMPANISMTMGMLAVLDTRDVANVITPTIRVIDNSAAATVSPLVRLPLMPSRMWGRWYMMFRMTHHMTRLHPISTPV